MELHQIDALDAQSPQAVPDPVAHDAGRHGTRRRAPFGESAHLAAPRPRQQTAHNVFGAAVMVGHVERVEPGGSVVGKRCGRLVGVQQLSAALHIGNLPQTRQQTRDLKAGRDFDARRNLCHWSDRTSAAAGGAARPALR